VAGYGFVALISAKQAYVKIEARKIEVVGIAAKLCYRKFRRDHFYSTNTLKAKLLNLIAKGKIARETQATLNAAKSTIETACTTDMVRQTDS
jgi:hypothetical protein